MKDCPHHITQRGNYKQITFSEDSDYQRYLELIKEYSDKNKLLIISYCLMPNHVHFIAVPINQDSFARTFNSAHMRYSQYYNKKNGVSGHLWQGRFYSCALDEKHLYEAVRYVENNPVRAGLVMSAKDWKYSSAKAHGSGNSSLGELTLLKINRYVQVADWDKYLNERTDGAVVELIKGNTLTGRPSGSSSFVRKLEQVFGMRLTPLSEGRPKKAKN